MKFGGVENPSEIDFTLPRDQFNESERSENFKIDIGYPKWTKKDLPFSMRVWRTCRRGGIGGARRSDSSERCAGRESATGSAGEVHRR